MAHFRIRQFGLITCLLLALCLSLFDSSVVNPLRALAEPMSNEFAQTSPLATTAAPTTEAATKEVPTKAPTPTQLPTSSPTLSSTETEAQPLSPLAAGQPGSTDLSGERSATTGSYVNQTSLILIGTVLSGLVIVGALAITRRN